MKIPKPLNTVRIENVFIFVVEAGVKVEKFRTEFCDGSDQADPHTIMTCAVSAPDSTEATRGDPLPIGSLLRPREHDAVKGVVPPIQDERVGIRSWRSKEQTGELEEEQQRTTDEEDTEDARTPLQEHGPEPESRSLRTRRRDEDRWPRGAHE
ncbi:hypothetical protein NDU88_003311 [Pleurodeles waltl]|uniref:Uncharacterized protein n=1 Tax=Pleurodeles waltl TaxID=8319 RepID=A0AAV7SD46_PLEWA|nr:hypothetical protein NDU88_003311 [Pleurodeles waltl]